MLNNHLTKNRLLAFALVLFTSVATYAEDGEGGRPEILWIEGQGRGQPFALRFASWSDGFVIIGREERGMSGAIRYYAGTVPPEKLPEIRKKLLASGLFGKEIPDDLAIPSIQPQQMRIRLSDGETIVRTWHGVFDPRVSGVLAEDENARKFTLSWLRAECVLRCVLPEQLELLPLDGKPRKLPAIVKEHGMKLVPNQRHFTADWLKYK